MAVIRSQMMRSRARGVRPWRQHGGLHGGLHGAFVFVLCYAVMALAVVVAGYVLS